MNKEKKELDFEAAISNQSSLSLEKAKEKEKTSAMRTTFRLTDDAQNAIKALSQKYQLKIIFDQISELLIHEKEITKIVAENAKKMDLQDLMKYNRKSFAVSQKAVNIFGSLTKKYGVSRDALMNWSIIAYRLLLENKEKEDVKKVMQAKKKIQNFWRKVEDFESELIELLGKDHSVVIGFGYVPVMLDNLESAIDKYLETGEPIDPYNL
ncbi:MAG: hypothetical protein QQN41_09030 [Nitrosopumilus sp.]